MGSSLTNVNVNPTVMNSSVEKPTEWKHVRNRQQEVDVDVIETANIALAIKHKQHISNLQLSLSAGCLPPAKAFQEMNTFIAIFKIVEGEIVELGRTEIISNELNPKFLSSFILPLSSEKSDQIQFHIYNCKKPSLEDLEEQTFVGSASQKLDILNDNQTTDLPVNLADPTVKQKTVLKITCCEYDGGNLRYEIELQALNFVGKLQLNYIIQVSRDSEWIPVARSNHIQIKKKTQFDLLKVAASKFPSEDNTRLRIRFYDLQSHDQIGCTDQLVLLTLLTQQDKGNSQRVYKNGFVVGNVAILRWHKVNRDSFLTYIVNGSRLHLILGIDFTNSNFKGQPLHHPDDERNLYIAAIREIVGMLQYFDYYNQIAIYGFGARLPPYYKCVGQCFALNDDYFNPLITGGVEEIIQLYKKALGRIQPHGPSKISEIINMAIQFAQAQYQSTNYYVLTILTDGQIDDFSLTVDKIIQASNLPLTIVIVGLGNGDFSQLQKMDQDGQPLKSSTGKSCDRDMIDFINFKEYLNEQRNPMTQTYLARKTFSELPSQFVDYMQRKGIKPNKEKKSLKTAKGEFITEKIKEGKTEKNEKGEKSVIPAVDFLKDQKRKMRKDLIALGFTLGEDLQNILKMPLNDLNYFIELQASKQPPRTIRHEDENQIVAFRQEKKFEEHLQKNVEFINRRLQNELLKREMNQTIRKKKQVERIVESVRKQRKKLNHPCLQCDQNEICMLYLSCGHLAVCEACANHLCVLCKQYNKEFININDYEC